MSFFLYSICIFREALLIITIFTNSDCLGGILSHRNNFPDDFEAIRKFISRYSKFTRYLISITINPYTFSSHHIFCVLRQTSYYSLLRSSLLSRLICKTRTQSKRKWQPLPGPGLCRIPLTTYSFTPDSLFTYTDYESFTMLVITALAISQSLRPQFATSSDCAYKLNIP